MKYMKPHMEVISVEVEDVIRTSTLVVDPNNPSVNPGGSGNDGEGGADGGGTWP